MSGSAWGEDPNKWVIKKSSFGRGWIVFPPHDDEAGWHPTFEAAKAAIRTATAVPPPTDTPPHHF